MQQLMMSSDEFDQWKHEMTRALEDDRENWETAEEWIESTYDFPSADVERLFGEIPVGTGAQEDAYHVAYDDIVKKIAKNNP